MLSHTLEINIKVLPSQEGISGCENSFKGYRCNASLAFFYCTGLINYLDDRLISASAFYDISKPAQRLKRCRCAYPNNEAKSRDIRGLNTVYLRFFDRFLTPSNVAHLAIGKRQSRDFPNTSIKQCLTVQAMSN